MSQYKWVCGNPLAGEGPYAVGIYTEDGRWIPESYHPTAELASERASYLNGQQSWRADCPNPDATR